MHIGSVAARTGASPKAIRLYEELGLLGPVRRQGAYRIYADRDVEQVRLIRQAQSLGFRLAELKVVLRPADGEPDWHDLALRLDQKRESVEREIQRLQRLSAQLAQVARETRQCAAGGVPVPVAPCPDLGGQPEDLLQETA